MSEQSKQHNECKCLGDKKTKALEKQIADLKSELDGVRTMMLTLCKEIATLRKAVHK